MILAGLDQPDTRAYGPPYYVRQKSAAFNFGTTAYSDMQVKLKAYYRETGMQAMENDLLSRELNLFALCS